MRCITFAIGLAATLCLPGAVHAADSKPAALAVSLTGEAASAYQSARLLLDDGDRAGALEKFKRAYDLSHDPRLLWNMAACEKELRHYARAKALVSRYVREGGNKLTAENRAEAAETEAALQAFYSLISIEGAPAGARVLVDEVELGTAPLKESAALDLGHHVVRVEHEGYEPFTATLEVPGNTASSLLVSMKPEQAAARLAISSSGARDLIKLDGKVVGTAHWEGALAPGLHDLRVTGDGKKPFQTQLLLAPHGARTLTVALESEERHGAAWPWVVGGVAVAGGLAFGGYLLFKPKDEAGSAPVGRLTTVTIPAAQ